MSCSARLAKNFSLLICLDSCVCVHIRQYLDVKRLWNVWDSKVDQFADSKNKVLEDNDKQKLQG
jgi:hypothetical protein